MPALTTLVLLVLWAGAGGRAGLVADLAAEEAAAAASAACGVDDGECLEAVAAEVLASRPGLGELCVDGPVPSGLAGGGGGGFVASEGDAVSVGVLCRAETVAPLGGLAAMDLYGQGTHVVIGPDRSVSITADQDRVTEGGRARFTVTVDPPPAETLEVTVTVTQQGDVVAAGYLGAHVLAAAPPPAAEDAQDADGADGPDAAGIDFGAPDHSDGDSVVFGFYVPTVDDASIEADGAVTAAVAVADGHRYRAGPSASVTVLNDDFPAVTVAAVTSPVTEGDPGDAAVHAQFTVTADQAPAANTTLNLTVTETANQLPAAAKGAKTVVLAAGQKTAKLRVQVPADNTVEADSTVTATITTGAGYTVGAPAAASATVRDDDLPTVTVAADAATVTEGRPAVFTVTADQAPAANTTLNLTVTETANQLPAAAKGAKTVVLAAGQKTANLRVQVPADNTVEADSTVTATITTGAGYTIGAPAAASATVRDDDLPTVTLAAVRSPVTEGDPGDAAVHAQFTVTADQAPAANTTLNLTVTETASQLPAAAKGAETVVLAAGQKTANLRVQVPADNTVEADSTVTAAITTGAGYTVGAPAAASVTVRDDDLPTVTITAGPDVYEGSPAKFTVTADQAPLADTTVNLTVVETASQLPPGSKGGQTVVLKAGAASVIHPVVTEPDDNNVESSSRVTATVTAGAGYIAGAPATDTLWVRDDDVPAVSVSAGPPVTEGQDAMFTVHAHQAPLGADLTVRVDITQTGQYADPAGLGARDVTIPEGDTTAKLAVATVDDATAESPGAVTATIAGAGRGYTVGAPAAASVIVKDNEPAVAVTAGPDITEGDHARFTIRADPAPTADITVTLTVTQTGTYVATAALGARNITIPKGSSTATLTAATVDDTTAERPGTATATLANGTAYTVGAPAAASVIVKDNEPAVTVTAGPDITEGDHARFTIRADPAPTADITVTLTVTQTGTYVATAALGARNITIPKGSSTATLTAATVDDTTAEVPGTVTATLAAAGTSRSYTVGRPSSATVDVEDNDRTVTITAGPAVTEGQPAAFTVHADPAPAADTRITVRLTQDGDFLRPLQRRANLVTLPAGAASTIYRVPTVDDAKDEPNGSVTATVTAAAGYKTGTPASAAVTVNDNDEVLSGISYRPPYCNRSWGLIEGASTNFCVFSAGRSTVDVEYTIYFTHDHHGILWAEDEALNKAAASTSCAVQGSDVVLEDWIDGTFGKDARWDDAIKGSGALRGTIPAGSLIHVAWNVEVCDDTVSEGRERIGLVARLEAAGRTRTFPNTPIYVYDND